MNVFNLTSKIYEKELNNINNYYYGKVHCVMDDDIIKTDFPIPFKYSTFKYKNVISLTRFDYCFNGLNTNNETLSAIYQLETMEDICFFD